MAVELHRTRFTVDQYERMGEVGILDEDHRVELIEGEIVDMAAIDARHASAVMRGTRLLSRLFGDRAILNVQNPVRLPDDNEPQPDLALLRIQDHLYETGHPTAADVLLLIEVAHTTLRYDRNVKGPIYARHRIDDYWIVDLTRHALIVLRDPAEGTYHSERVLRRGESIAPLAFPDSPVAVADLLGS